MMNRTINNKNNNPVNRVVIDERFERNAGINFHKGRDRYSGGSGFYAVKPKPDCPNVNDRGRCGS